MAIVMSLAPGSEPGEAPYSTAWATARAGSNGDPYGAPESAVGTATTESDQSIAWDPNDTNGGFNSGVVPISFTDDATTGEADWHVGDSFITVPTAVGDASNIDIAVGVSVPDAQVILTDLTVTFYSGNTVIGTATPGTLGIDTSQSPTGAGGADMLVQSTVAADKVVVTGNVQLVCPDGTYPNPDDLYAAIYAS